MIIKPKIEILGNGSIDGTRTTIYHVMDYYLDGWPADRIADRLNLETPEAQAAIEYIDAHRAEVDERYRVILERCERGNPPEIRAKMEARRPIVRAKMAEAVRQFREAKANGTGQNGTHQ